MVSTIKDPVFVESGRRGAEKRWSDPENRKLVRLDDLTAEQRAVVLALVNAAKAARAAAEAVAAPESPVAA